LLFPPGTPPGKLRFAVMEYELKDGEDALFDDSTNPSLDHSDQTKVKAKPAAPDKRKLQKAELIPEEEEHQLA
jgi:hypothetical protein